MRILDVISNIILISMLFSLINLIRYMFKIRKVMNMNKDNPNVKGISIVNGEVKVIETTPTPETPVSTVEWIEDPVCGKKLDKSEAYRIVKEDKEYFFCSWECREKFLKA